MAASQPGGHAQSEERTASANSAPEFNEGDRVAKQNAGVVVGVPGGQTAVAHLEIEFGHQNPTQAATGRTTQAQLQTSSGSKQGGGMTSDRVVERKSTEVRSSSARPTSPMVSGFNPDDEIRQDDDGSGVSSLTGAGFDQEIVEELHQALTEMKAELEASRAEAARAVKVAEQAIQSAENNSSKDWNSTVTHKAAEAAAQAQKRSAEAMAKQRLAEDRLASERKTAAFWRRQAETAEEEAGALQTRAAVAEIQRAALVEELDSERTKASATIGFLRNRLLESESKQREAFDSVMDRTRSLEIELDGTRRDLTATRAEAKTLEDELGDV